MLKLAASGICDFCFKLLWLKSRLQIHSQRWLTMCMYISQIPLRTKGRGQVWRHTSVAPALGRLKENTSSSRPAQTTGDPISKDKQANTHSRKAKMKKGKRKRPGNAVNPSRQLAPALDGYPGPHCIFKHQWSLTAKDWVTDQDHGPRKGGRQKTQFNQCMGEMWVLVSPSEVS